MNYQEKLDAIYDEFRKLKVQFPSVLHYYRLDLNNRVSSLGLCDYETRTIYISKIHLEATSIEEMLDTVRHEVAHAYSYYHYGQEGTGHNQYFYDSCIKVGAKPKRCATATQQDKKILPKYVAVCKIHGVVAEYHRFTSRICSCHKCHPRVYKAEYRLDIMKYEDYIKTQGETK